MTKDYLEKLLLCPNCRGEVTIKVKTMDDLGIKDGVLVCLKCGGQFEISDGIFYLRKVVKVEGDRGEEWKLEEFEERYKSLPVYKSAIEWGNIMGIPEEVTRFMYPKVKGRILELLQPHEGDLILDVGCGVGYFLFEILEKNQGLSIPMIGLDVAVPNIKRLRERCKKEKVKNILCVVADAQNLPISNNSIDHIVCTEVLEHVPSPSLSIGLMARMLKKNGTLLISTPLEEANKKWRLLSSPFRALKNILKNKNTKPQKLSFDVPISSRDLKEFIEKEHMKLLVFERNVILPPEGYFKKLPGLIIIFVVASCEIIEKHFKKIFQPFAMHAVIKIQKV